MKEYFQGLSSPLSERAKSPLIGSFIVSWMVINWRLIYATAFLSNDTLKPLHKLDYVLSQINICNSVLYPLLSACIYIFIFPYINFGIFQFTEKRKRERIDEKIKIGRQHSVPGDLYYDLKLAFEHERKNVIQFEEVMKEQNARLEEKDNEIVSLRNKAKQFEKHIERLNTRVDNLFNFNELSKLMPGRWYSEVDGVITDEIELRGNAYSVKKATTGLRQ